MNADFAKPIPRQRVLGKRRVPGDRVGTPRWKAAHARVTEPGARARVPLNLGLQGTAIDVVRCRYRRDFRQACRAPLRCGTATRCSWGWASCRCRRSANGKSRLPGVASRLPVALLSSSACSFRCPAPRRRTLPSWGMYPLPQAVLSPTERLQVVNGSNGGAICYRQKLLDALGDPETPARTLLLIRRVLNAAEQCVQWANSRL